MSQAKNHARDGSRRQIPDIMRKMDRWLGHMVAGCVIVIGLGGMVTHPADAAEPGNITAGSQIYGAYCLICHGEDGRAKGPLAEKLRVSPSDLTGDKYQKKSVGDLVQIIAGYKRQSDEATAMPNWGVVLREEELTDVASFLLRLKDKSLATKGDTRRGRIIYQRACASCHGRFGAGDGVLAGLLKAPMKDFSKRESMEKLSDAEMLDTIRTGGRKFMPAWRGLLSDHEIDDVAAYIRVLTK